jgi:hypothetical protein
LQPAQLEALQEEQPEDNDRVLPSPPRDRPEKVENICSTSVDPHLGQAILSAAPALSTSFSNSRSHFTHWNSNIGTAASQISSNDQMLSEPPRHFKLQPDLALSRFGILRNRKEVLRYQFSVHTRT